MSQLKGQLSKLALEEETIKDNDVKVFLYLYWFPHGYWVESLQVFEVTPWQCQASFSFSTLQATIGSYSNEITMELIYLRSCFSFEVQLAAPFLKLIASSIISAYDL